MSEVLEELGENDLVFQPPAAMDPGCNCPALEIIVLNEMNGGTLEPYPGGLLVRVDLRVRVASYARLTLSLGILEPQKMWIMNLVWPIAALYFGPVSLWLHHRTCLRWQEKVERRQLAGTVPFQLRTPGSRPDCSCGLPLWRRCTLGDAVGELGVVAFGLTFAQDDGDSSSILFWLIFWASLSSFSRISAPMRGFVFGEGLKAVRADTISITLFEIGMFDWMALTYSSFPSPHLRPTQAVSGS